MLQLVTVGYEEVFGTRGTWDGIVDRLRVYQLEQILDLVSRVSTALSKDHDVANIPHIQHHLSLALFRDRAPDLWMRIHVKRGPETVTAILFYEEQLLNLVKVALIVLPPAGSAEEPPQFDRLDLLGEALLMMTDVLETEQRDYPADPDRHHEALFILMVATAHFGHSDPLLHVLTRAYDLYLEPKPHLQAPHVLEFPRLIERITGVESNLLRHILYAFHSYWLGIDLDEIGTAVMALSKSKAFEEFNFTAAETDGFFQLVSQDVHDLQRVVRKEYRQEKIPTHHFLPFVRRPLVVVCDKVYCLSVKLLRDSVGMALQHRFLEPTLTTKMERDQFFSTRGLVFEDYMSRVLRRAITRLPILDEPRLKARAEGSPSCDMAVLDGTTVVLFEAKATMVPYAALAGESYGDYMRCIDDVFVDGATPIASTIAHIREGRFTDLGFDPSQITRYLPVVVFANRYIYPVIDEQAKTVQELQHDDIGPLMVLTVSELERLEILLQDGRSLAEALSAPIQNPATQSLEYSHYWILMGEPATKTHNPMLGTRFHTLTDEHARYLVPRPQGNP